MFPLQENIMFHKMKCDICGYRNEKGITDFQTSWDLILKSGREGCPLCFLFSHALVTNTAEVGSIATQINWDGHRRELAVIGDCRVDVYELFVSQDRVQAPSSLPDCIMLAAVPPGTTSPPTSAMQVKTWLDLCSTHHPYCDRAGYRKKNRVVALPLLPNRILDVGVFQTAAGNIDPEVKLIETSDLPEPARSAEYLCLSHRWGSSRPLCATTQSTLQDNKAGMLWTKFSKTFQDAIIFTRHLGFRYLWIDSCCIIQDDEMDWTSEGAKMCGIYKNSTLTLAATASNTSDGGCFQEMDSQYLHKNLNLSSEHREALRIDCCVEVLTRRKIPHKLIDMPLLSRAWVYQERLLPQRVVHFTANELIWECSAETLCQCFAPNEFPSREDPRFETEVKKEHLWAVGENLRSSMLNRDLLMYRWHEMVEEYSALKLSYNSDKLIAIAGLAKDVEHAIQRSSYESSNRDLYTFGLWKDTLIQDLLWFLPCSEKAGLHTMKRRAPSWSWGSINGPIRYVSQGALKSLITSAQLVSHFNVLHRERGNDGCVSAYVALSGPFLQAEYCDSGTEAKLKLQNKACPFRLDRAHCTQNSAVIVDCDEIFCLKLGQSGESNEIYYLMLSSVDLPHKQDGLSQYKRIGFLVVNASDSFAILMANECSLQTIIVL